jgi:hypothetical protein
MNINKRGKPTRIKQYKQDKLYREKLGLLTVSYTNKLINTIKPKNPSRIIKKIIQEITVCTHKMWQLRCHMNTLLPNEDLGVGA